MHRKIAVPPGTVKLVSSDIVVQVVFDLDDSYQLLQIISCRTFWVENNTNMGARRVHQRSLQPPRPMGTTMGFFRMESKQVITHMLVGFRDHNLDMLWAHIIRQLTTTTMIMLHHRLQLLNTITTRRKLSLTPVDHRLIQKLSHQIHPLHLLSLVSRRQRGAMTHRHLRIKQWIARLPFPHS